MRIATGAPALDALDDAQRALLVDELGWFGDLALAPPGTDSPERVAALAAATGEIVELLEIARDDSMRGLEPTLDQSADLGVDRLRRRLGHVLGLGDGVAEEHLFLVVGVAQRPEP